jgi:hypothetical protein
MPSTAAPQALMLMNSDFILDQSRHFAQRLLAESPSGDDKARVTLAWRLAYQRAPSPEEVNLSCKFLQKQKRGSKGVDLTSLSNLCQQLLASNEFLYVD